MAWRLAGSLQALKAEVLERFPGTTVWSIGDAAHRNRASDHNPNPAGVVCAIDVVGQEQGHALWDLVMAKRPDRVKYVIWKRRIVSSTTSPWVPRHYSGSNPHDTHIHISVGRGGSGRSNDPHRYDDSSPWGFAETEPKPDPPSPPPADDDFKEDVMAKQVLSRGDRSADVKILQSLLVAHGIGPGPWFGPAPHGVKPDGIFGQGLKDKLTDWQRYVGLPADGVCDSDDWRKLLLL